MVWYCLSLLVVALRTLNFLARLQDFAGAPLSTSLGTQLVKSGVQLNVLYGSTEIGLMLIMNPTHLERGTNAEEWMYIEFPPEVNLRVVSAPETSFVEIQFLVRCRVTVTDIATFANKHIYILVRLLSRIDPLCAIFPMLRAFRPEMSSRLNPARKERGSCKHCQLLCVYLYHAEGQLSVGTNDDTIIHSSTAKTTPGPIEDTIQSHEVVKGVIAFGEGRDKVGILVEY